ncbi:MAG: NAD(+)/NADH kinase [Elusimicrobiota bacterium]
MKKILIVYNPDKKEAKWEADLLERFIEQKGAGSSKLRSDDAGKSKNLSLFSRNDICLALGGDGTILKIAETASRAGIPVVGVNVGSLGFLSEFDTQEIYEEIKKIAEGKFRTEKRILLDISYSKTKGRRHTLIKSGLTALNDCVVRSGSSGRVILLNLKIGNIPVSGYTADGLIVATPTGSTAYSLASGGPIINPALNVLVITPISPHALSQRPIIVSSDEELSIEIPEYKSNYNIIISVDGQRNFEVTAPSEVRLKKSKLFLKLITNPGKGYYEILRKKLGWGSVPGKSVR